MASTTTATHGNMAVSNVLAYHYRSVSADDTLGDTRTLKGKNSNIIIPCRTMPFAVVTRSMTVASPMRSNNRPLRTLNIIGTKSSSFGNDQRPITGVKRKTAVELLEESKAYYVKSERVLDVRQEWPHSKSPVGVSPCNASKSPSPHNEIFAPTSYSSKRLTPSGSNRSWLTPKPVTSNSTNLKKDASPNMSPAIEKKRLAIRKENPLSFNVGAVKRLLSKPEEVHIQMNPVRPLMRTTQYNKPQPGISLGDLSHFRTELSTSTLQYLGESQPQSWAKEPFRPLSISNNTVTQSHPSFVGRCACHSLPIHTIPVAFVTPPPVPPKSPGLGARLKQLQEQLQLQQHLQEQAARPSTLPSALPALPALPTPTPQPSKVSVKVKRAPVEKSVEILPVTNSSLAVISASYEQAQGKGDSVASRPTPYLRSQSNTSPAVVREEPPMRRLQSEDASALVTAASKMAAFKSNTWIAALHKSLPDLSEDKPARSKMLRRAVSHISSDTTDTSGSVSGKGDEAEASSSSSTSARTTSSTNTGKITSTTSSSPPTSSSPMPCSSQTSTRSHTDSLPPGKSRSIGVLSNRDRDPHRTSDYASRSPSFKLDAEGPPAGLLPAAIKIAPVNHLWQNRTLGRLPPSVPVRSNEIFMAMFDERPTNSGRPTVVRSKSDISHRHPRSSSTKSLPNATSLEVGHYLGEPRPAELDAFFDRAMLSPPSLSEQSSPVFFSSVSSFDSWQKRHGDASGSSDAEGCAPENMTQSKRFMGSLVGTGEPSIVERNARIIKWLFNCRKAQSLSLSSTH